MIKQIVGTICLIALGIVACRAQSNSSQTSSSRWMDVQGVRMSITLTNDVIEAGSTITLVAVIKNSSTNAIHLGQLWEPADYDVLLTSGAKKVLHLIQEPDISTLNTRLTINPGEQNVRVIPVTFGKSIEPGDYTLSATRRFAFSEVELTLESNSIKVKIIK